MSDSSYIAKYKPRRLYVNPSEKNKGAYASICDERDGTDDEVVLDEFPLKNRTRIAVSAFIKSESSEIVTLKLTQLRFYKGRGWYEDQHIAFNGLDSAIVRNLIATLSMLDLSNPEKAKIDLGSISTDQLLQLTAASDAQSLLEALANHEGVKRDVFAVKAKRDALAEYKTLLDGNASESEWQSFFERNEWIFGFGLNYVFLQKTGAKFEQTTTGAAFDRHGKRADGLARTRAYISNSVLIEIKKSKTQLLRNDPYRGGVYQPSQELSGAVSQAQKTAFEFAQTAFKSTIKDDDGRNTDDHYFRVSPKTYLVIGSLEELENHDDKSVSFELFRRSLTNPEVLTFDELYYRAEALVSGLEGETPSK